MDPNKHEDQPSWCSGPWLGLCASEKDYINFLCKQGYNTTTLRIFIGDNSIWKSTAPGRAWDLNYPSFSLNVEDGQQAKAVFNRTVTNVGTPNSTYTDKAYVAAAGITISVQPQVLTFSTVRKKLSFTGTVNGPKISEQPIISGAIVWEDGVHVVRTPLVLYNYIPVAPYIFHQFHE